MAISAEQLNIILTAKDREFARAMERNQRRVERFAKQSNKSLGSTSKAFGALSKSAAAFLPALSAGALVAGVKRVTSQLDEIGKTADRIGITTDALQLLRVTAESAGVAQGSLDNSIEKLGKGLAEATQGIGTAKDALEVLGLNARDLIDLGLDGAMGAIAEEINKLPTPMEKTAIATQLFGRSGAPMLNLLREGADGMARMQQEARELGVVIDEELIRGAEDAQTQLDLMSRVINAELSSALISLAPLLVSTSSSIAGLAGKAGEFLAIFRQLGSGEMNSITRGMEISGLESDIAKFEADREDASRRIAEILDGRSYEDLNLVDRGLIFLPQREVDAASRSIEALTFALSKLKAESKQELGASDVDVIPQADLSILESAVDKQRELARLAKMTAEQRERARIEAEANALADRSLAGLAGSPFTIEAVDARLKAQELRDAYIEVATAASTILNPVKSASSATSKIKVEAESARDAYVRMLNEMIAASPALQQLGFDADNLESTMAMVESRMEDAFMGMVDGTMSAKDAFKSMAADIIKELFRVLVVQRLVGSFDAGGGGILGAAFGAFGAAAHGGTVQSGSPTVVGEHGRELFVPQQNGRIMTTAQTKQMQGGGGSGVTIVQNINVSTGVQQTVRTEIKQLMPQIAESAKSAVADAKLRGGSYGRSFA